MSFLPESWRRLSREVLVGGGLVAAIAAGGSGLLIAGSLNAQVQDLRAGLPDVVVRLTAVERELSALGATAEARNEASARDWEVLMDRLDRISADVRALGRRTE